MRTVLRMRLGMLGLVFPLAFATPVAASDEIDVRVIADYENRQCRGNIPSSTKTVRQSNGIVRLTGWVQFTSTATAIQAETYLYEWARSTDKDGRRVLTNYTFEEHLTYERSLDRQVACYWVTKRVFANNAGVYDLTIYVRRNGELHTVGRDVVTVEPQP